MMRYNHNKDYTIVPLSKVVTLVFKNNKFFFKLFGIKWNHPEMTPESSKARLNDWVSRGKPFADWTVWLALVRIICCEGVYRL
jgi:hypothetical protein